MKKLNLSAILPAALSFVFCAGVLAGCGNSAAPAESSAESSAVSAEALADTGTIVLRVNPEIAVHYDDKGIVTAVEGLNDDGKALLADPDAYIGMECREAVRSLVADINEAGYFVEETEGENKQIVIEIEQGSAMPTADFLDNIVTDVRSYVSEMHLASPVDLEGESNYGITNYQDTDYGPDNDGVTDYDDTDYGPNNDGVTDYSSSSAPAAPASSSSVPSSVPAENYDDTDYGPNNDGVTNYDDTDYGPNNDGVTNYDDTDYGPNNDGVTNYDDTDYGPNNDGVTNYDDTDYGPNNDGVTNYDDGSTNYDDGGSTNYDDGSTNYDDGGTTNYGDSGYDD